MGEALGGGEGGWLGGKACRGQAVNKVELQLVTVNAPLLAICSKGLIYVKSN